MRKIIVLSFVTLDGVVQAPGGPEEDTEGGRLKRQDGPDLQVHGSSNLIQTLLEHDLVDALWLKIFPLTLGKGKRLFGEGAIPAAFRLLHAEATSAGVLTSKKGRLD